MLCQANGKWTKICPTTACPATLPADGDACDDMSPCSYDLGDACHHGTAVATCVLTAWKVVKPACP